MKDDRYELADPTLIRYDHAVAELRINGELRAHLACVVGKSLGGAAWPWFRVIWLDGRREPPEEDYGPGWWSVREWDVGKFTYWARPGEKKRGWFGITYYAQGPDEVLYDAIWLPREEAENVWRRLGLHDDGF